MQTSGCACLVIRQKKCGRLTKRLNVETRVRESFDNNAQELQLIIIMVTIMKSEELGDEKKQTSIFEDQVFFSYKVINTLISTEGRSHGTKRCQSKSCT